jgi:hypothetical protein
MIFSIGSPHRPSLHTQTFLEHLQIKSPKGVRISEALLIEQLPNALSQKTLFLNSSDGLLPGCFALYSPETLAITPSTAFYYEATSHQKAQETLQRNHIQNVKLLLAPTPLPDEKESFDPHLPPPSTYS